MRSRNLGKVAIFIIIITVLYYFSLPNNTKSIDKIYLSLDKKMYDKQDNEIKVTIHNETNERYTYGARYDFQILKGNKWIPVPYKEKNYEVSYLDYEVILEPNSVKQEVFITDLYDIAEGKYRYIKKIGEIKTVVEFNIK